MKKILEYFNNLNDQMRYGILGAAVFLIILLDVFFLVLPQWGSIDNINQQIIKLTQDSRQVLTDTQRIGQLRRNLEETRLRVTRLSDKVRPIAEVPAVLGIISSVANECGVNIDQLAPDKTHQVALQKFSDGQYYALPIVIKARCGYHMFGHFLNRLEKENIFFMIKDFIIQNEDRDPHTHLFSLTIKIIMVDYTKGQSLAASKSL